MAEKLSVWAPKVPGLETSIVGLADTMDDAHRIASRFQNRRDLYRHDVYIRLGRDGVIIEYCGPCR